MRLLKNVRYDLTAADPALGRAWKKRWKADLIAKVAEGITKQG